MRLESAIPEHLRIGTHSHAPDGVAPPYPTYVARFRPSIQNVVMCYLGVQGGVGEGPLAAGTRQRIRDLLLLEHGPAHWDEAMFIDQAGCINSLVAAYWTEPARYSQWAASSPVSGWWNAPERLTEGVGYYREVFAPQADGFETHFSTGRAEGVATLSNGMSGEIREHGYWGSARHRIPRAQTEALEASGKPSIARELRGTLGQRVRVQPHDNLCLIRSGQDWTDSDAGERALYDADIRPHLEAGMRFLMTGGQQVGCHSNRFVRVVDAAGRLIDKTYGMSMWRSLGALEDWASGHPTHLAIFSAGVAYMRKLGPSAGLRTYHEISVVRAGEQSFEYVNCHARTGMLNAIDFSA